MPIRNLASICVIASLTACGPSLGDDGPHTSSSAHAITSTKWVSCYVRPGMEPDPDFRVDTVECTAGISATGPLPLQNVVISADSKQPSSVHAGDALIRTGEPTVVARARPADFPLELTIVLAFGPRPGLPEITGALRAKAELTDDRGADRPLVLEQPFDIWPVTFQVNAPWFYGAFKPYDVPLAPFTVQAPNDMIIDKIAVEHKISPRPQGKTLDLFLLVPRGTRPKLGGMAAMVREAQTAKDVHAFEVDGPGVYTVESDSITRTSSSGQGTLSQPLDACPASWRGDGICDPCLGDDPDCKMNGIAGCEAQWFHDGVCDACLGNDVDCGAGACPASWRGDGVCDPCLGNDPDCAAQNDACPDYYRGDGICDTCLGDDPDCASAACPASWRGDGVCDTCLGDDPDCAPAQTCPESWRGDGVCDPCLGNDPDCAAVNNCPPQWYGDGVCDPCLGDDPDCAPSDCPISWYGDGVCDTCLGDDPDCT